MKKRFTAWHFIGFLKVADSGVNIKQLLRQHGFSDSSFQIWRSKFGEMNASEALLSVWIRQCC